MDLDPKNPNSTGTNNIMAIRGGVKENAKIWDNVPKGVGGLKKTNKKNPNFNMGIVKTRVKFVVIYA